MKKITIAIMSLFMIMSFSTIVSAAASADNNGTGGSLTVDGSVGAGPDLTFNPSPSTLVSVFTSATNYTLITASSKTTTSTGIEYGLDSDTSVVYQKVQATDSAVTAATSATALPGSDFKDKAGTTAPNS